MKVILLQDVKSVGKKGQIVNVSDGYGANFLIPRKLAVLATKTSLEIKDKQDEQRAEELRLQKEAAIELSKKLESLCLELSAKAGDKGKMYGAISTKQIEEEMKKQFNIEIDKRKFIDVNGLTCFGTHLLKIELFKGVIGTIKVHVSEK
ncbi:MAG: 50S ribosomal protein L9 [Erysipelotrichaceae bacterium]|nr:50S ribosomal protein L9 [Erysipelotrichaceae bacterium]